ncbi:MAG: hypothetical protein M1834_007190 [Cirrosporium novae-zelandiae]|nr:MAG: hypothetical protein M1834_007190 [Cirrosporium novae-zelandiae]
MSGTEIIAVVGIIANFVSVVDFTIKAAARVKRFQDDTKDIPEDFQDIFAVLPLLSDTLEIIKAQVESGQINQTKCTIILPIVKGCEKDVISLEKVLGQVIPQDGTSKWRRARTALSSMNQDTKVRDTLQNLREKMNDLMRNQVANLSLGSIPIIVKPKKYYMAPITTGDDFVGREKYLNSLETRLCQWGKHCRVALFGLGGIGKTRIALEYANRLRRYEDVSVFWIHASSVARIEQVYFDIAAKNDIPGYQDPKSDKLQIVKDWFQGEHSGKWLLIIDNADDYDTLYKAQSPALTRIADYLPRSENGSILLTTRYRRVATTFARRNCIPVSHLTTVESTLLLARILEEDESSDGHDESCKKLADTLDNIPLALVQAVAYISMNTMSIETYLQLYDESDARKIELLSEDFEDDIRDQESKNPIATTWNISFEHIRKYYTDAADILSFMSVLHAQNIPETLLPNQFNTKKFEEALGTLQNFSLVTLRKIEGGYKDGTDMAIRKFRSFDLHRLVRLATRNWLSSDGKLDLWTTRAIKNVLQNLPDEDWAIQPNYHRNKAIFEAYLPHILELISGSRCQIRDGTSDSVPTVFLDQSHTGHQEENGLVCALCYAELMRRVACYYNDTFKYHLSIPLAEDALTISRHAGDNRNETTINCIRTFGVIISSSPIEIESKFSGGSRVRLGQEHLLEALQYAKKHYGDRHLNTLRAQRDLANRYVLIWEPIKRLLAYMEVLSIAQEILGQEHPFTLDIMANLPYIYGRLKRLKKAQRFAVQTLMLQAKVLEPNHPEGFHLRRAIRVLYTKLILAYVRREKLIKASRLLENMLKDQHELMDYYPRLCLFAVENLAYIYHFQCLDTKATELLLQAVKLPTKSNDEKNRVVRSLAYTYLIQHDYKQAEKQLLFSLGWDKEHKWEDSEAQNLVVLLDKLVLIWLYKEQKRYQEATEISMQILRQRCKELGNEHASTQDTESSLTWEYFSQRSRLEGYLGQEFYLDSLSNHAQLSKLQILADKHSNIADTANNLLHELETRNQVDDVVKIGNSVIGFYEETRGSQDPTTQDSMEVVKRCYKACGKSIEDFADSLSRRRAEWFRNTHSGSRTSLTSQTREQFRNSAKKDPEDGSEEVSNGGETERDQQGEAEQEATRQEQETGSEKETSDEEEIFDEREIFNKKKILLKALVYYGNKRTI